MMELRVVVAMERRGDPKRVRDWAGREKERGWSPRRRERRVVLPEPGVGWVSEGEERERGKRV